MTVWTERYEKHSLNQFVEEMDASIEKLDEEREDNPEFIEANNRIVQIHEILKNSLAELDPNLIAVQQLDALSTALEHELAEISNFLDNKNVAHLVKANDHADTLLLTLGQLHVPTTSYEVESIGKSVASLRQSTGEYSRSIKEEIEDLDAQIAPHESRLAELQSVIDGQKARLDDAVAEFQRQFSEAENSRSERFTNAEGSRDSEHREAMGNRQSASTELLKSQDEKFNEVVDVYTGEFRSIRDSMIADSEGTIATLEEHKERAQRLVYVIADTGMAGGYQRVADEERRLARRWQLGTAISLIFLIGSAIVLFISTLNMDISIEVFLARAFVTGTFGIFAGYSARQASRHSEIERYNRRMELEIASIEPYLENLPPEKQIEIKEDFAKKVFGREAEPSLDYSEQTTGSMFELAKMLSNTISDLAKR